MHKVTQLRAIVNAITQIVILLDVLLEEEAVGAIVNQPDLDRQVIPQRARHRSLRVATRIDNNRTRSTRLGLPQKRQLAQPALGGQLLQKSKPRPGFQLSV